MATNSKKKSYRCPKFDGDAKQTLEIRVERKRNLKLGELGEVSFRMLKMGEVGEMSFRMLKLGELGEVSFGKYKLGELDKVSFGILNTTVVTKMNIFLPPQIWNFLLPLNYKKWRLKSSK